MTLEGVKSKGLMAVDTETTGLHVDDGGRVSTVSIAWRESGKRGERAGIRAKAFPFDQGPKEGLAEDEAPEGNLGRKVWDQLLHGFHERDLVMHNFKFDCHMLRTGTRFWPGIDVSEDVVWDTMLAASILDPTHEKGLKEQAVRHLGYGAEEVADRKEFKEWLKKNKYRSGQYDMLPWEMIEGYATKDAVMTLLLAEMQQARIEAGEGDAELIEREFMVGQVLYRMEERGVGFDWKACEKAGKVLRTELDRMAPELPFGNGKPTIPKAKAYFFGDAEDGGLGLIPHKMTDKGGDPALDEEVLEKLVMAEVPGAKEYQRYRSLESAWTRYYSKWPSLMGPDDRLRTVFKQATVVTGRLAVERVQLQAIPHDDQLPKDVPSMRTFFRARNGYELWEMDLRNAEVRVAAAIAKCESLRKDALSQDVHGESCKRVFGIDESHPEWKNYRNVAKRITFGTIYGGGAGALQKTLAINPPHMVVSREQAQEWIDIYKRSYPEIFQATRKAEHLAATRGWLRLAGGRQRWFGPMDSFHKAFNAVIQGGVAEMMKDWMVWIEVAYPGVLLLQIHDSIVLELPTEETAEKLDMGPGRKLEATEIVERVKHAGEAIFEKAFGMPFEVEVAKWHEKK